MTMIRTPRFATGRNGGAILKARPGEHLAIEEIAARCPAVFAEQKHSSRSERYEYTDTRVVLQGLMREGFMPTEVRQGGSRDEEKRGFTKHLIRLRRADEGGKTVARTDVVFPEVVLINSHDGTSSYQLAAGLFRIICTNGLIAGDMFEQVRVPHRVGAQDQIIDAAFRVVEEFPAVMDGAERMAALQLNGREQLAFATAARELRWSTTPREDGQKVPPPPLEAHRLLAPRRAEDNRMDLWRTMNVVQENLIQGGQNYTRRNPDTGRVSRRSVGRVTGIDQDRSINRALWTLAAEMERIKAAA